MVDPSGVPVLGVVRHITEGDNQYPDQITIGTPGKGGELKIRFNSDSLELSENRIRAAFRLREIARSLQETGQ